MFTLIENDHLGDWSFEKDCCLATTLPGRSMTGTLASRSKGPTRTLDTARRILLDDAEDEVEECGVGDSINTDGEGRGT